MTVTLLLPDLWSTLGGVFYLQPNAFVGAASMSQGAVYVGLAIVLLAGFSEAIAQSIVLFANRVKPARFFFSWAIDAFLFLFGYGFLVLSTWTVCRLFGGPHLPLREFALIFAVSYAPLLFSFLGALPYLGPGILRILRVWHLLAMIVGVSAVAHVTFLQAGAYVALGWIVMVLAQQSFGKPIAMLGTRLLDAVAGVRLVEDENLIIGRAQSGALAGERHAPVAVTHAVASHPNAWKVALGLLGVAGLAFIVALALDPMRKAMFGWQEHLPAAVQLPLDLFWLGIVAIVVAGLMAPLETLGWWAGWYGDDIDLAESADMPTENRSDASRFVVYLDGIAQSSSRYTPDIETFLDALAPELPSGTCLVRGVMGYSVLNKPLEDDPLFSRFWAFLDALRLRNAASLLGMIINLRNVTIVAVSADARYGPMYNFGIARVLYRSLLANGYVPRSGVPVTLIGYSGGGQMSCAAAAFLKRAIDAPIDVVSLGGVISGSDPILQLEHLYHLVGTKDRIEPIGPFMFPSRWKIALLSNWNRAKRLGRLTQLSLGPVGHQVPGGMLDPNARIPDGRTNLRQTLDIVGAILTDRLVAADPALKPRVSNYERYVAAAWNRPEFYPLDAPAPKTSWYLPVAPWVGRLILPAREQRFCGALLEVHHAPSEHAALAGKTVRLVWNESDPRVRDALRAVRRDVNFSAEASYTSTYGGLVHPVRVNRWRLVDPLESLAGSHPIDDVLVKLTGPVTVVDGGESATLRIERHPVQITGRWYGLVKFIAADSKVESGWRVAHYDAQSGDFSGGEEVVRVPPVIVDGDKRAPSVSDGIDRSPLNERGWYVYGTPDTGGTFVVQSLAPRALLSTTPQPNSSEEPPYRYVRKRAWRDIASARGECVARPLDAAPWKTGDTALLVHTYGGIGGSKAEGAATGPVYFGHFAYGIARVVDDPLSHEPRFEITYYQIYTHNTDGLIAGAHDWSRYMGDRQFGWAGVRPVCDLLYRHDALLEPLGSSRASAIEALRGQLEVMTARYRIGDGTGGTYVGAANNCSQDSNRALFATLRSLRKVINEDGSAASHRLRKIGGDLRRKLLTFGAPRRDWSDNEYNLGSTMEDAPVANVVTALGSWRCILPRLASETIAGVLLHDGASAWLLGSDAIGGERKDVTPVVPMTL